MTLHDRNASAATLCVRAGRQPDPTTGSIVPPLHQTTTFAQNGLGGDRGFTYSRASNPTVSALEEALGALEHAPAAVCHKTGMAAITTLLLSLLEGGDRIAVGHCVYGGTVRLVQEILEPLGIASTFFDPTNLDDLARALEERPRLVFIETPANPTLEIVDIERTAALAHDAGAIVAVDNTFQTALGQAPLDLGADISVYSTTKFIEGHDATLGGALVTRDTALIERFRRITKSIGCIQSPFEAWLTLRGLSTLPLRLVRHSQNALRVAEALQEHDAADSVHHPGLASFPGRALADQQHLKIDGIHIHGGIVSFEVAGGLEGARAFLAALDFVYVAENLGAAETLATHPATMTHGDVPAEARRAAGITDGFVRLSIGLEDPEAILADLLQALDAAAAEVAGAAPALEVVS